MGQPFGSVKIFGERNTSTNALSRVLAANSGVEILPSQAMDLSGSRNVAVRLARAVSRDRPQPKETILDWALANQPASHAWKHCATLFDDLSPLDGCLVVVCVRHPASWLLALHRRPYNRLVPVPRRFADFLRMDWPTVRRDNLGGRTMTPVALYNEKLRSYRRLIAGRDARGQATRVCRFETFAVDQEAAVAEILPLLRDPAPRFRPLLGSTKEGDKDAAHYADYYGAERWRAEIDAEAADLIAAGIDRETAAAFGY